MKYFFFYLLVIFFSTQGNAQFYYFDIIGTKQTNTLYKQVRVAAYKKITGISYNGSEPSKDFVLEQTISKDGKTILTRSASVGSTETFFTGYYDVDRIVKSADSGKNAITTVQYEYDSTGKLQSINSVSNDFDGTFTNTEDHLWSYNQKGLPEKMLKIKNMVDTTVVSFIYDEENQVAEERWTKSNRSIETYYYYYNQKKQITDIVKYNRKAKAMLPDFIFEYNDMDQLSQMTQTQSGSANYLIWRYTYNDQGLKVREVAYNKEKELMGRIEYSYQ